MTDQDKLTDEVAKQTRRIKRAERERRTILAQSVYLGTLGLLFIVPLIAGAYLGRWLDSLYEGYSVRWTISLIVLGIVVGAVNVYLLVRE
jgi:ATP synthase protein I